MSGLFPPLPRAASVATWRTQEGPLLFISDVEDGVPLIFAPGFGAAIRDYSGLCESFAKTQPVIRVGHPGSDRWAAVPALARLLWYRALGHSGREAAIKVRTHLHRSETRERRLRQLTASVQEVRRRTGATEIDLAGHSFGTDTALMLALSGTVPVRDLWLFSPHPPGYLIAREHYAQLPVRQVQVVVGSRDWTRDGVGPRERLTVAEAVGVKARANTVEGHRHMDFAGATPMFHADSASRLR